MDAIIIPPSETDQTDLIQRAIDDAHGPVELRFTKGAHPLRGIRLRSDVTLWLDEDATLVFETDYDAYSDNIVEVEAEQSNRAMIMASDAKNIEIGGEGVIFCNGSNAFSSGDDEKMGTRIPFAKRPRVLVFDRCENVKLHKIAVVDSPMWTLHFTDCDHLSLRELTVDNDRRMPNTDGIVIDGCRNVEISECTIRTADDGVVLKTSERATGGTMGTCTNVRVQNCVIESKSCALKIGTESFEDFRDITFENCKIEKSNRGLGIFSRDGGNVDGVVFRNIQLECIETPSGYWGSGEPVTITVVHRRPHLRKAGSVRNVVFDGITGSCEGAINIYAEEAGLIDNLQIDNVALSIEEGSIGTALSYDIRPTPADLEESPDAAGRINAWRLGPDGRVIGLVDYEGGMPALFTKNVGTLSLGDALEFNRPSPLPQRWNRQAIHIT